MGKVTLWENQNTYSLFLIPYSLFLIPYSLFLIPYSLFLIPYSLFLIPYSLFLITYYLLLIPYSLFPNCAIANSIKSTPWWTVSITLNCSRKCAAPSKPFAYQVMCLRA